MATIFVSRLSTFTLMELLAVTAEKRSAVLAGLQELTRFSIIAYHAPCKGRKACYTVEKTIIDFQLSSSTTTTKKQTTNNKTNECANETQLSSWLNNADFQTLCAEYHLAPAFLAQNIELRQKTIGATDLSFVRGLLEYSRKHATRSFEGLVFTLMKNPKYENPLPQFATMKQPIAQESGYTPPQATPERQAVSSIAPPVVTPPRATQTATTGNLDGWKDKIKQKLQFPSFKTWVLPCSARKTGDTVTITTPDPVFIDHLQKHYLYMLSDALQVPIDGLRFEVSA